MLLHRASGRVLWHSGTWSTAEKALHINVLEMIALQRASEQFAPIIGSSPVLILIDSTTVKFSIRRRFSPSLPLNAALHSCAAVLRGLSVTEIRHVLSANNLADLPSRGSAPRASAVENYVLSCASG